MHVQTGPFGLPIAWNVAPSRSSCPTTATPRTHSPAQIIKIAAAAIQEWGWTNPMLVDETGRIIAGHGRILAAKKLGIAEVPVMVAAGWTEAQRHSYD